MHQPDDGWEDYWSKKSRASGKVYDLIATAYRTLVIRRNLESAIFANFPAGSKLLHAGCGSGGVDTGLHERITVTAVDTSAAALRHYKENNPKAFEVREANIFALPFPDATFDGAYNLGVVEHFTSEEIVQILQELHRVTRPNGKLVIFWPHARATSVAVLKAAHWLMRRGPGGRDSLHPPEISLLKSREWVQPLLARGGFDVASYSFGPRDFFVQAIVVAAKRQS